MLVVILSFLAQGVSAGLDDNVLNVWSPAPGRSYYRDEVSLKFINKLQEVSGYKVSINGSSDWNVIQAACANYEADHMLINVFLGQQLVDRFGYKIIAYGETPVSMYTANPAIDSLDKVSTLGFLRRTGMDRAVPEELPDYRFDEKMLSMPSDRAALESLLTGHIDALVMSEHKLDLLPLPMRSKVRELYDLQARGVMLVLVSPTMDGELRQRLQKMYFSDDPLIVDLFGVKAGVTFYQAPLSERQARNQVQQ